MKKKKRKLNPQKIFKLISFLFLLSCFVFYGGRFVKLYLENNRSSGIGIKESTNNKTLLSVVKAKSKEDLVQKDDIYYFYKDADSNYVSYSNLIWRIIKIENDNLVLISDNSLTSIAYREDSDFEHSYAKTWLNINYDNNYSGILENNLNDKTNYLIKNNICLDEIDDIESTTCNDINNNYYIGLLSLEDYINTGAKESFINNGEVFYLSNTTSNNKVWYINNEGKTDTSDGTDIMGIRAVITLKEDIKYNEGDGTIDNPYLIDSENNLFGSYVKLGNDTWRVYKVIEDYVKLVSTDYLKDNEEYVKVRYSNDGYYHNDTTSNTLAYYLNNTYLNSLSYQDIIEEVNWSNGILGSENDYDYIKTLTTTIPTKVSLLSLGDINLNPDLDNYFTSTGVSKNSILVYTITEDKTVYGKATTTELNIVPTICIKKELLIKGKGTKDSPYEME